MTTARIDNGVPPTLHEALNWAAEALDSASLCFAQGTSNAVDEAAWLVLHALGEPVDRAPRDPRRELTPGERSAVAGIIERRIEERCPAAYLTGTAWFAGLEFEVDEHVLVPRSPIAELIGDRFEPWCTADRVHRVLDLCTGSGCIAIACAVAFPTARVIAADVSAAALRIAARNVRRHSLADRVQLVESDLFDALQGERYDLIVSNPPYVPTDEVLAAAPELQSEPRLGLDGGDDGLDLVARILLHAARHLTDDGTLIVEVGATAAALESRFPAVPFAWPELSHAGGVFVLTGKDLNQFAQF